MQSKWHSEQLDSTAKVHLELYDDMFHVFLLCPFLEESKFALTRIKSFVDRHLDETSAVDSKVEIEAFRIAPDQSISRLDL